MREEGLYYYMKYVNYLAQLVHTADSEIAEIEAMSIVIEHELFTILTQLFVEQAQIVGA